MRTIVYISLLASAIVAFGACTQTPGPDSISSHGGAGVGSCLCHISQVGSRRPVIGADGDFASNPAVASHHVAGGSDPTSDQCLVCHDLSQHTLGTVLLRNADTGTTVTYNPAAPSTLEPFCLSCHDADGALLSTLTATGLTPFNDGAALGAMPYQAGITIASSWNGSSTHRSMGLTCAGTGTVNTGCHGRSGTVNAHGSVNRGLLTNTMNFQIPLESLATYSAGRTVAASYNENNYKLCFDCHANYSTVTKEVVLGFLSGGVYDIFKEPTPFSTTTQTSQFRDHWNGTASPFYSDTMFNDPYLALHNYHLLGFESQSAIVPPGVNALQWKYRGDPAMIGRITCTACHNVHGTSVLTIRSTYEALGLQQFTNGGDVYVSLGPLLQPGDFLNAPMNCAIDCHGHAGQTSYWKIPGGE